MDKHDRSCVDYNDRKKKIEIGGNAKCPGCGEIASEESSECMHKRIHDACGALGREDEGVPARTQLAALAREQ